MLDAGRVEGADCSSPFESEPERSGRRQYTLKGIESEAIDLMRDAARVEGMKIGSWVSLRIKEAACKALAKAKAGEEGAVAKLRDGPPSGLGFEAQGTASKSVFEVGPGDRLARIERDIHELTKMQMIVMAKLLEQSS